MFEMENLIIRDTPDKFRSMAAEIVPPLLELLRERSALEGDTWERASALRKRFLAEGGSPNQRAPGTAEVVEEYQRRYLALAQPRCVPGFLKYGAVGSYGIPTKYGYLDTDPDCQVFFTMKTAKKAVVVTHYSHSTLKCKHRFSLRPGETGGWLISKIEHGYQNMDTWHLDYFL